MAADESDKHQPLCIPIRDDQAVVIALDVEHDPVVWQKAGVSVCCLDVAWLLPVGSADFRIPVAQGELPPVGGVPNIHAGF